MSNLQDVSGLSGVDGTWQVKAVCETVSRVRQALPGGVSFIGFCGAPWTVASYMIEGRGSAREKALAVAAENAEWFQVLIDRLVEASIVYLLNQIEAGVEAVQIFDSWAGDVPVALRKRVVFEPMARIVAAVKRARPTVPVIGFGRGIGGSHGDLAVATGVQAVGIEQGVDLKSVLASVPRNVAVQGNLDPAALLGPADGLSAAVRQVVEGVPKGRHIFNLGHGITPDVKPEQVQVMLNAIRGCDG